jgi:prepilin signal peptidase PulO-like enzyme (type II secretory pathway)
MYYFGQWGGGDAKVLSAMGFLLPTVSSRFAEGLFFPFAMSFFFNVFLIGSVYMVVYAFVLSVLNKKIWDVFLNDLKANSKMILLFNVLVVVFLMFFGFVVSRNFESIPLTGMLRFELTLMFSVMGFFLLWRFAKTVENVGFKRKIPVDELRVGDVLLESKVWEGVTKERVDEIKKSGKKYVSIKEGVRFAPAFPLALAFTLFVGDGIVWLIGWI